VIIFDSPERSIHNGMAVHCVYNITLSTCSHC